MFAVPVIGADPSQEVFHLGGVGEQVPVEVA
jgi:hypothetical protein